MDIIYQTVIENNLEINQMFQQTFSVSESWSHYGINEKYKEQNTLEKH